MSTEKTEGAASAPVAPTQPDWRELCRRLYVELFHCDKQMTCSLNEDGEPIWRTGTEVRDVLSDAKAALEANPVAPQAVPVAPSPQPVQAGVTTEQRRIIGVIADKIEDGTLFQSGIYSKKDLARFVRNMLDAHAQTAAPLQQGEYLPLPKPDTHCYDDDTGMDVWSHSAEQMRAYFDAARAQAAQPEGGEPA